MILKLGQYCKVEMQMYGINVRFCDIDLEEFLKIKCNFNNTKQNKDQWQMKMACRVRMRDMRSKQLAQTCKSNSGAWLIVLDNGKIN